MRKPRKAEQAPETTAYEPADVGPGRAPVRPAASAGAIADACRASGFAPPPEIAAQAGEDPAEEPPTDAEGGAGEDETTQPAEPPAGETEPQE